jgi:hypothetical protein
VKTEPNNRLAVTELEIKKLETLGHRRKKAPESLRLFHELKKAAEAEGVTMANIVNAYGGFNTVMVEFDDLESSVLQLCAKHYQDGDRVGYVHSLIHTFLEGDIEGIIQGMEEA